MSAARCLSACSSPQASSLRRRRRERAFAAGEAAAPWPRLSLGGRASSGGLSQEELDALCRDSSDAELADADDEALDGQLVCQRRAAAFAAAATDAPLSQEQLDLLCVDSECEESLHRSLRRARAYGDTDLAVEVRQALAEIALYETRVDGANHKGEESEDSFHRTLRRARVYGGPACAEALRRAALAEASEASTETASCATPSSSDECSESPTRRVRSRAEVPRRAAELEELVAGTEPTSEAELEPAEVAARAQAKSAVSPWSMGRRVLKAASPNRRNRRRNRLGHACGRDSRASPATLQPI